VETPSPPSFIKDEEGEDDGGFGSELAANGCAWSLSRDRWPVPLYVVLPLGLVAARGSKFEV
jgi:hypothetical protein